jgi:hypothetical protein
MIVHTLMISLAYPENLNKLIDILYSVVSFDLVQSDSLSTYFFDFNSLENADPLSLIRLNLIWLYFFNSEFRRHILPINYDSFFDFNFCDFKRPSINFSFRQRIFLTSEYFLRGQDQKLLLELGHSIFSIPVIWYLQSLP